MHLLNHKFILLEKIRDFNFFSLYLTKDKNTEQKFYLIFQINNNLISNNLNVYLEFLYKTKKIFNPVIIAPIDFQFIYYIDDIKANSSSFFILYPYDERFILDRFIDKPEFDLTGFIDKIIKIELWLKQSGFENISYSNSIIMLDENSNPFFLPIFQLNIDQVYFKNQSNLIEKHKILNFPSVQTEKNLSISTLSISDYRFLIRYFNYTNSIYNIIYDTIENIFYEKINISNNSLTSPRFEKPILINFNNFPSIFITYIESFLFFNSKQGFFNFLSLNSNPDRYSLLDNFLLKILEQFQEEIDLLNDKKFLNESSYDVKKNIAIQSFYPLAMKRSLIITIKNLNVADIDSIKFLESLLNIKNLHFPIIFISFDYNKKNDLNKNKIENIEFQNEIEINELIKYGFIESLKRLFSLNEDDLNFLKSSDRFTILNLLQKNPLSYIIDNQTEFKLKKEIIQKSALTEIEEILNLIYSDSTLLEFFIYFRFFEKPTPIVYLKEIFGKKLFSIINRFLQNKLFFIDENNKLTSNQINLLRTLFQEILKTGFNKEKVIKNISEVYFKYQDQLNQNETFTAFTYFCDFKQYHKAATIIDNKILLNLTTNYHNIKTLFFKYLQKTFNNGKKIDFIEDLYSRLIIKLFYFKLKFIENDEKLENIIYQIYKESKDDKNFYRFIIEKILFYIKIHETEKIEKDFEILQGNFKNLPGKYQKLYLYAKAEDYFARYDPANSIKFAKEAVKLLDLNDNFDNNLYLPLMHRMVNSIIYSASYKKAVNYLKYFLNKAIQFKDTRYIYYAYNNLGVVNYRNKEFEKARFYLIQAFKYQSKLKDKTLMFINYNNLNLFEIDQRVRIERSKKMLKLAPFLTEKTYFFLCLCNTFLFLINQGNFDELFNIFEKHKEKIFIDIEKFSQYIIRRILHLYTILVFPFYLYDKEEYLQIFYNRLEKIKNKIESEKENSELKNLFYLLKPLLKFLILNLLKKENTKEYKKIKDELKNLFIEYSQDKDRINNTEFFPILLGIYGSTFFAPSEFSLLIENMVKKFGKDPKTCNSDLIIYYRLLSNKKYFEPTLIRYLEKYFKLYDIDPWSSSGLYFKSNIILLFLRFLKLNSNDSKFNLYLNIFYNFFEPYFSFINSEKLFFNSIKKQFQDIFDLLSSNYPANINYIMIENEKRLAFSEFIKFPNYDYRKSNYKKLLNEIANNFSFDRAMLYLYENKEMKLVEKMYKEPILYIENEPSYSFIDEQSNFPLEPFYKKLKNSTIYEILYLPIYYVDAIPRFAQWNIKDKNYNFSSLLKGYIYLDSKISKNRLIIKQTINFCSLYISELFERVQIETIYMRDFLTKLLTRENFIKKCLNILHLNRLSSINAFLMIDIDNFKKVNDTYGHQKGDIVLSKIANIMQNSVRSIDIVGRYGGEEFTICLPDTSPDYAYLIAERIRINIENSDILMNQTRITVSIGISFYPNDGILIEELINKADRAMYISKNSGKNRTTIFGID